MAIADTGAGHIDYEVVDLTAPWVESPETIVFHHGIGINRLMWTKWLPAVIDRYRLVLMDMRGFGRSVIPEAGAAWHMDRLVRDVFAVAAAAGAPRFHFVGESMGGTVGLCTFFHDPSALISITVSNGAHVGGTLKNLSDWRDVIDAGGMDGWSAMMSGRRFYDDGLPDEQRRWFDRAQAACSADSCLNALDVLRGIDLTDRLGEIDVPVLLLHGDSSPFIPTTVTADLHAGLPRSEVQIFPHAKHGLPLSHGDACGRALRAFLDRVAAGAAS